MANQNSCDPRRHHFVPACWLAGFTTDRTRNSPFWVTDISRKRQWESTPHNTGWLSDFYRVASTQIDPVVVENAYAKLEDVVAPILRILDAEKRAPDVEELVELLPFMADQWTRLPAFRKLTIGAVEASHRAHLDEKLIPDGLDAL